MDASVRSFCQALAFALVRRSFAGAVDGDALWIFTGCNATMLCWCSVSVGRCGSGTSGLYGMQPVSACQLGSVAAVWNVCWFATPSGYVLDSMPGCWQIGLWGCGCCTASAWHWVPLDLRLDSAAGAACATSRLLLDPCW